MPDFLRARRTTRDIFPPPAPPNPRLPQPVEDAIRQAALDQHRSIKQDTYRSTFFTATAVALNLVSHLSPLATVMLALTGHPLAAILTLALWPLSRATSNSIISTYLHGSLLHESNFLQDVARRLAPMLSAQGVGTITFGHTHHADLARLDHDVNYFNTGTWIPIFSDDTRLDAREQAYLFVEVHDGASRLLRWNDTTGTPEPPKIIDRSWHSPRHTSPRRARK